MYVVYAYCLHVIVLVAHVAMGPKMYRLCDSWSQLIGLLSSIINNNFGIETRSWYIGSDDVAKINAAEHHCVN